jgi:hypothetical protein
VEVANFEVASDAFSTFKDLLTRHKAAVAAFLSDNYAEFFDAFYGLLQSSNYVTRRQSLKVGGLGVGGFWGEQRPAAVRQLRHPPPVAKGGGCEVRVGEGGLGGK